jgi:hypothetical protein
METVDLSMFPQNGDHLLFCDAVKDDLQVKGATLWTCHFLRIGVKNAAFEKSSLTQCLFEDTYLRNARFSDVRLTGSTFRNCNLEKASFQGCDLRYCTFQATRLDRDEIIGNLPVEPNLKRDLARNLRKNFEALGDQESADVLLKLEIEAHELELLATFRRNTAYYQSRYNGVDQMRAGLKYFKSKFSGIIWGYGRLVHRLVASYIILSLVFALITYFYCLPFVVDATAPIRSLGFWESIYYTFAGTLGLGTALAPVTVSGKALQLCQGFLGTIFLALLAAAAYRRIAR